MIQDFKIMQLHEQYEEYSENCKDNGYEEIIDFEEYLQLEIENDPGTLMWIFDDPALENCFSLKALTGAQREDFKEAFGF